MNSDSKMPLAMSTWAFRLYIVWSIVADTMVVGGLLWFFITP